MWDIAKHYDLCQYCLNTSTDLTKMMRHQFVAYLKSCSVSSVMPLYGYRSAGAV